MSGKSRNIDRTLDDYRKQVLRWNDQINLVSSQDTEGRLDGLVQQCRDGWDGLAAQGLPGLTEATRLWFFDLGSGAGLPGIVWHVQMVAAGLSVRTLLVEPREKRAWFLKRMKHLVGPESLQVLANRWGEIGQDDLTEINPEPPPSHVLISLKALHLPDFEVLEGLVPFLGGKESPGSGCESGVALLVARFYPPDQEWNADLARELDIPSAGESRSVQSLLFKSEGGEVLQLGTPPGASLVLSRYLIQIS